MSPESPFIIDEPPHETAILLEQIRLLHQQIPLVATIHFLLVTFIAIVMAQMLPPMIMFSGWLWMTGITLSKYMLYTSFDIRQYYSVTIIKRRYYLLTADALITGISWGSGITILANQVPPEYQIFLFILVVTLASAAIGQAIKVAIYYTYQIALLGPVLFWLLYQQNALSSLVAIFLCIFAVLMWVFANQVTDAISKALTLNMENKRLATSLSHNNSRLQVVNEELTQLSATDGLTHVANRRYFEGRLIKELSRANRDKHPIALIMLDVDYFKTYNDILGHLSGDECLKHVANCIRESLKRPTDIVARFGGEEFIVLLANTHLQGAISLADDIRCNVETLKIIHPESQCSKYVTVSVGVSSIEVGQQVSRDTLLIKVDEALYKAKAAGRNNVKFSVT